MGHYAIVPPGSTSGESVKKWSLDNSFLRQRSSHHRQFLPTGGIARGASRTPHDPAWSQSDGPIADRAGAPRPVDRIDGRHASLGTLPVMSVKEVGLDLMGRYQCSQEDARFLITIAFTEYL